MSMRQIKIVNSITSRESQSLEKYLQEIGKVELVTPEEEVRLSSLIKQGNAEALKCLIKANLRFVVSVSKQYQNQGLPLSDLINEGNLGLIKAAQRFDETKGFKFISYAVWWIRQSILQALAEQARLVRLPLNKVGLTSKIQKTFSQLEQQLEREPSAEEIAQVLNMDLDEVIANLSINSRHISMDVPLNEGEENCLLDVMENTNAEKADAKVLHYQSLNIELNRAMHSLTNRQKEVLCYFFGLGMDHAFSLDVIGEKLNLTRERVRQIKDKALDKLRSQKNSSSLKSFINA